MKAIWTVLSTIWTLVAAVVAATSLFYGLIFFSINPSPWNFPGDPPFFELLAYCGSASVLLSVPLWLLTRRFVGTPRVVKQFVPTPVTVQLRGYGPVRLRMAHGVYPYVGVDFSDASHALFDPRTMWCTYSDSRAARGQSPGSWWKFSNSGGVYRKIRHRIFP